VQGFQSNGGVEDDAQKLIELGSEPQSSSPSELRAYMRKESDRWSRVIRDANLKIER
jgi:tripartite-type tricarboxylate transporter receptor subunit TctC